MKIIPIFLLLLLPCFTVYGQIDESENEELKAYKKDAEEFRKGEANSGESYFTGVLGNVILIDYYFRKFTILDYEDAPEKEFKENITICLSNCKELKKALPKYDKKEWPLREEFETITNNWVDSIEYLVKTYITPLAEPFSRPDDTWTEEELELHDTYLTAYDNYIIIDENWVDFQYEFAKNNNFLLEGQVSLDDWLETPTEEEAVETPGGDNEK